MYASSSPHSRKFLDLFPLPLLDLRVVPTLRAVALPGPPPGGQDPLSLPQLSLRRTTPPGDGVLLQVRDPDLSLQGQLHLSPHVRSGEDRALQGEGLLRESGLRRIRTHALPKAAKAHQDGGPLGEFGKKAWTEKSFFFFFQDN